MLRAVPRRLVVILCGAAFGTGFAQSTNAFYRVPARISQSVSAVQRIAVFGEDDRRPLPANRQVLARKIGSLIDLSSGSRCTAFCLSREVIATAAHCLYKTRDEPRPNLKSFRFKLDGEAVSTFAAFAGAQSPAFVATVASGSMSLSVHPPIDATRDWALIKLDRQACVAGGLPLAQQSARDLAKANPATPVYQVGYHRDFPGEHLALGSPCTISQSFKTASWATIQSDFSSADHLILHSCDTGSASSGSPLLIDGTDGPEVVGINVGTYVQSRVLMVDGLVAHRYQAENVANTAVSMRAVAGVLPAFQASRFLSARSDMRELQILLSAVGAFSGPRDGLYGESSRAAIETFERVEGRPITGWATVELLAALRATNVARLREPRPGPVSTAIATSSIRGVGLTTSDRPRLKPVKPAS